MKICKNLVNFRNKKIFITGQSINRKMFRMYQVYREEWGSFLISYYFPSIKLFSSFDNSIEFVLVIISFGKF
jgi:hypothetical protein